MRKKIRKIASRMVDELLEEHGYVVFSSAWTLCKGACQGYHYYEVLFKEKGVYKRIFWGAHHAYAPGLFEKEITREEAIELTTHMLELQLPEHLADFDTIEEALEALAEDTLDFALDEQGLREMYEIA